MKFEKKANVNGAFVPHSALKLSEFKETEELELHTRPGTVVVTRNRMTAAEIVQTVEALTSISTYLINHLVRSCGPCDMCDDIEGCPYDEDDYIELPEYLREEAGIPEGEKLCAQVDASSHSVTVSSAGYKHDLRDIPEGLLAVLRESGICLGELEDRLMTEDIIYG